MSVPVDASREIATGERFAFGQNWRRFLDRLDDQRIGEAERALRTMLGVSSLDGRTFLDVGSGSGLSSLAARRLGAAVVSFDFDTESVACTAELRRRYFPDDPTWRVEQGSALDDSYLESLGTFDVVYSWGVLHHTGDMWRSIDLVAARVDANGLLALAIYNDQGPMSRVWARVKALYNRRGRPTRRVIVIVLWGRYAIRRTATTLVRRALGLPPPPATRDDRGMAVSTDIVDWAGGYPFEVAKPEDVFRFATDRGFTLVNLSTVAGDLGCNEFVFQRVNGCAGASRSEVR